MFSDVNNDTVLSYEEVAQLQLFSELPREALLAIASRCKLRHFALGEHVLHANDSSSDLFYVVDGRVRVLLYSPSGRDVSFRDLLSGEVFGELAAIDGGPRAASVVAHQATKLAVMSRAEFMELTRLHPSVNEALLKHLVALIRRYSQRVYELSTLSVEERIRMQVLRIAWETDHSASTVIRVPAPSLADLASMVSTTREAVSREISRLSKLGLLRREGRELVIDDLAALTNTVEALVS
ncbi:MAG: CRP/FNR family cyclic AMP-dependent transcriptional regulator [Gammaproteobacteria bacterium]|jgi:CRP/FNR family cyclic AMP-dependent transcriptional regulator